MNLRDTTFILTGSLVLLCLTACHGTFEGVYDDPSDQPTTRDNQIVVDARDWGEWIYFSFDSLKTQTHFTPYAIPQTETITAQDSAGIYTYWFDIFGEGLSNYEFRSYKATAPQPEPDNWDIAIHRNNVRTNGGAVLETNYSSIDELPEQSTSFYGATFTPDEWSERDVWVVQDQMLQLLIGCQGIKVNKVLSNWLRVSIPPIPPKFDINTHVFLVKLKSGKMAALQLANYMDANGNKCYLTINYKYPY